MSAPAYDDAGDMLCDGASCSNLWRVELRGDGGRWCRSCEPAARKAFEVLCEQRKAPDPPAPPCSLCGSQGARLYPAGWRCDLCSPAAMRARESRVIELWQKSADPDVIP